MTFQVLLGTTLCWVLVIVAVRAREARLRQRLTGPGGFRVVLQVPGPRPAVVAVQLRRCTGMSLQAAMGVLAQAPTIAVENRSRSAAEEITQRLRRAGALATCAPMGTST
jgi:ribosomal protein L7/L12